MQVEKAQKLAEELGAEHAIAVECNVTREEDVERLVGTAVSTFKAIDVMVNNAGGGTMGTHPDGDQRGNAGHAQCGGAPLEAAAQRERCMCESVKAAPSVLRCCSPGCWLRRLQASWASWGCGRR